MLAFLLASFRTRVLESRIRGYALLDSVAKSSIKFCIVDKKLVVNLQGDKEVGGRSIEPSRKRCVFQVYHSAHPNSPRRTLAYTQVYRSPSECF